MDQGALVGNLHLGQCCRRDKATVPIGPGRGDEKPNQAEGQSFHLPIGIAVPGFGIRSARHLSIIAFIGLLQAVVGPVHGWSVVQIRGPQQAFPANPTAF
jgi:hypothetical protein